MSAPFQPDRMPGYVLPKYQYRKPPELQGSDSPLYPVIVVGAGLAGLTAALELGGRGVRTLLLDDRLFDRLSARLDAMASEWRAAELAPVIARIEERKGNLDGI